MVSNIAFIVVFSVCLLTIVVLLIVQGYQKKKGVFKQSTSNVPDELGMNLLFSSAIPNRPFYLFALQSYTSSLSKLNNIYSSANEDLTSLSKEDLDNMYDLCAKNIKAFKMVRQMKKKIAETGTENLPTYKYLSMIFVIRGEYDNAINACATAISMNTCDDAEKIKMKDRIYELAEEGHLEISDKIKELFEYKGL